MKNLLIIILVIIAFFFICGNIIPRIFMYFYEPVLEKQINNQINKIVHDKIIKELSNYEKRNNKKI